MTKGKLLTEVVKRVSALVSVKELKVTHDGCVASFISWYKRAAA